MGDEKGRRAHDRRVEGTPAVTPNTLWPTPRSTSADQESDPSFLASWVNHPSVRAKRLSSRSHLRASADPRVILRPEGEIVDLSDCGNGCGKGVWCVACRADIRAEALQWLRELNVPPPRPAVGWARAWHRELLLAD